jgi:hypothetical protein
MYVKRMYMLGGQKVNGLSYCFFVCALATKNRKQSKQNREKVMKRRRKKKQL